MEYRKEYSAYEAIDASDVALIFEGGGMRAAYTTAVLATLLEEGIRFPKAYGISAWSVLAVDYAAQDLAHAYPGDGAGRSLVLVPVGDGQGHRGRRAAHRRRNGA